jgi:hypothetical protein
MVMIIDIAITTNIVTKLGIAVIFKSLSLVIVLSRLSAIAVKQAVSRFRSPTPTISALYKVVNGFILYNISRYFLVSISLFTNLNAIAANASL